MSVIRACKTTKEEMVRQIAAVFADDLLMIDLDSEDDLDQLGAMEQVHDLAFTIEATFAWVEVLHFADVVTLIQEAHTEVN